MVICIDEAYLSIDEIFYNINLEATQIFHEYRMNNLIERITYLKENHEILNENVITNGLRAIVDKFISMIKKLGMIIINKIRELLSAWGINKKELTFLAGKTAINKCRELIKKYIQRENGLLTDENLSHEERTKREEKAREEFNDFQKKAKSILDNFQRKFDAAMNVVNPKFGTIREKGNAGRFLRQIENNVNADYDTKKVKAAKHSKH